MNQTDRTIADYTITDHTITDHTIVLSDGRTLGFSVTGDPEGIPLITCHGLPGSRMESLLLDEAGKNLGYKIITPDRPGYGISTYHATRSLLDWNRDMLELANQIDASTFDILGISGGAPYALSCLFASPQRVNRAGLVCGLGPLFKTGLLSSMQYMVQLGFHMARLSQPLVAALYGVPVYMSAKYSPGLMLKIIALKNGKADRQVLSEPLAKRKILLNIQEAFRQQVKGAAMDMSLCSKDWGFDLAEIKKPVLLWHGDKDKVVPLEHSQYVQKHLAQASLTTVPGEAHFSLPIRHAQTILEQLKNT